LANQAKKLPGLQGKLPYHGASYKGDIPMNKTRQPTILVVEDDEYCRDLLEQILTMHGYTVKAAANGLEAWKLLQSMNPDLILLDMKMPVMNGWEFSRRLKAERDNTIPFVIISAAEDIRLRAQETGANGWLEKPFEMDDLLSVVDGFVKKEARV
jgi:CheY-like chemotaxis protein